jgi:hypothetical protein
MRREYNRKASKAVQNTQADRSKIQMTHNNKDQTTLRNQKQRVSIDVNEADRKMAMVSSWIPEHT